MSEHTKDTEDLETWAKAQGRKRRPKAWESWPQRVKDEIEAVLQLNDEGEASVSRTKMVQRIRLVHSTPIGNDTLDAYCREVLGRKGWDKR